MKVILSVLLITAIAVAGNDGYTGSAETERGTILQGTDDISLTVINTFDPLTKALGLDVFEEPGTTYLLGVNNDSMRVQAYDATTGGPLGFLVLDAANSHCFGIAWNNDPDADTYYTDDYMASTLFFTDDFGTSWSTGPNPAGSSARGMDFDGTDYWTTNGSGGGLWRFQPGVGEQNLAIPEVAGQPSGVAVFPYSGDVGVAVTNYSAIGIWFYVWDGSTLDYLGMASCPATCSSSYGLAYNDNTGTLFWSYSDGSYKVSEVNFDINVSLDQNTWAGIKASF